MHLRPWAHFGLPWLGAALMLGCGARIQPRPEPMTRLTLPTADLDLDIPGLGPCTEALDRTLHLDRHQPVFVLVHGCRGSAGLFQALAQVIAFHGQQAVGFSYAERDSLMAVSGRLARCLETLSAAMGDRQIIVLGHSMGGLIARKALVADRADGLRGAGARLTLVTISAPFAGIEAASHCGSPVARALSLGLVVPICRAISGEKWFEITYASDFIRKPGRLIPQVDRHLILRTDERGTCRRLKADGTCAESDAIFALEEQRQPQVEADPRAKSLEIKAGHVEIVGDRRVAPVKLLAVLQAEGLLAATPPGRQARLRLLLDRLYGENLRAETD